MKIRERKFKFAPFSVKQKKVLSWWADSSPVKDHNGIIADGAIRSGKTMSMSLSFVLWAMSSFSDELFAMCGKTIGSFRRNVLPGLKLMLRTLGYRVEDHRVDNLLVVALDDKVNYIYIFGGKDERSQDLIQGITLAGVFFDEVALMPESFVKQATARCSVEGSKYWFNCNPEGPNHWFYKEWILKAAERQLLYLHFDMDDNLSLSENIKARFRAMYSGVFYQRYILGLWVIAEGLVYQLFDREKHVTETVPQSGRYFVSIDYGTINPFSAGLWCLSGGVAYRIKEYYYNSRENDGTTKTDEEYYSELEALTSGYSIEKVIIDPSAASMITTIKRHGKYQVKKAENDVIPGIRDTTSLLAAGRLKFKDCCKDSIAEFGMYRWDTESKEDAVIKENDHAMDDIRYFVYTILRKELRWSKWS